MVSLWIETLALLIVAFLVGLGLAWMIWGRNGQTEY
jgi:hypothetical protein